MSDIFGEQPFVPGIDRGLRDWARASAALRAVKENSKLFHETVPSRIKYRYRTYWEDDLRSQYKTLIHAPASSVESEEALTEVLVEAQEDGANHSQEDASADAALVVIAATVPVEKVDVPLYPVVADQRELDREKWTLERFEHFLVSGVGSVPILNVAFDQYNFRLLDMALAAGININTQLDQYGKTMLHFAAAMSDVDKVDYLLKNGANPKLKDSLGNTPLHLCMNKPLIYHPPKILRMLLEYGANVNARNNRGTTPLHRACLLGAMDFVEILLKHRAKVFVFDKNGQMPIQFAGKVSSAETRLAIVASNFSLLNNFIFRLFSFPSV